MCRYNFFQYTSSPEKLYIDYIDYIDYPITITVNITPPVGQKVILNAKNVETLHPNSHVLLCVYNETHRKMAKRNKIRTIFLGVKEPCHPEKTIFSAEKYYLHHVRGCSSTLRLDSLFCFLEEISSAFEGQFTSEWSMSKLRLRIVGRQASANMVKYTGVF